MAKKRAYKTKFGEQIYEDPKTKKWYGPARTVTTRQIERNKLRTAMKKEGYTRINKKLSDFWETYQNKKYNSVKEKRVTKRISNYIRKLRNRRKK